MFDYVYEWLRNISYYLILVTAVCYVLPSASYRKYIRFFTGLVLISMLLAPVINLIGRNSFSGEDVIRQYEDEIEQKISQLEEVGQNVFMQKESARIEVEEVRIGP